MYICKYFLYYYILENKGIANYYINVKAIDILLYSCLLMLNNYIYCKYINYFYLDDVC